MRAQRAAVSHTISGMAYFIGEIGRVAPIYACHIVRGRIQKVRPVSPPDTVWSTIFAPSVKALIYSNGGNKNKFLHLTAEGNTVVPVPYREYRTFSPNGKFVTVFVIDQKTGKYSNSIAVCRTDNWKAVWQQQGFAQPVWDRSGWKLVFARYLDAGRSQSSDRNGYWTGPDFPPQFDEHNALYRRQHTHLFVANFNNTNRALIVQRISEGEATRLTGQWFPAYLRLCAEHDSLSQPSAGQVLVSSRHKGVVVQVPSPVADPDAPMHPPEQPADVSTSAFVLTARGVKHFPYCPVSVVCWSKDGSHVYGDIPGLVFYDSDPASLLRLNVRTGTVDSVVMPRQLRYLINFIED